MESESSNLISADPACAVPRSGGPVVCIIVPTLNEEAYITACLESLLRQKDCDVIELIVADGGSTDRTVSVVKTLMLQHSIITLVHNPRRIQSAGINLAAKRANPRADVLVRADAHVTYESDFVARCVAALRGHGATSVVVPMRTVGRTGFQRAVAAAQNSRAGNGGSAHRLAGTRSKFVEHGHHAAFDRSFFLECSGYDESFPQNEDAELDVRALQAGGRIWLCAEACVDYFPRATPVALARQYLRNGRGRARTLIKHRIWPQARQLAPVFLLLILSAGFCLSAFQWEFLLLPITYFVTCFLLGIFMAFRQADRWLLATGPAVVIMHLSFALGFLQTIIGRIPYHQGSK